VRGEDSIDLVAAPYQLENAPVRPGEPLIAGAGLATRELRHHSGLGGGEVQRSLLIHQVVIGSVSSPRNRWLDDVKDRCDPRRRAVFKRPH
jgi:hypothetical protein